MLDIKVMDVRILPGDSGFLMDELKDPPKMVHR